MSIFFVGLGPGAQARFMRVEDGGKTLSTFSATRSSLQRLQDPTHGVKGRDLINVYAADRSLNDAERDNRRVKIEHLSFYAELIPGAYGILANGLGITVKELRDRVEQGDILEIDAAPILHRMTVSQEITPNQEEES